MGAKPGVPEAIAQSVGEAPICWGIGQSLESRYSQSGRPNALAALILRRSAKGQRRADAIRLPRLVVVAVTPQAVYFFDPPMREPRAPLATALRADLRAEIDTGPFWTRLILVEPAKERSYTIFFSKMAKGRKQILDAVTSLSPAAQQAS